MHAPEVSVQGRRGGEHGLALDAVEVLAVGVFVVDALGAGEGELFVAYGAVGLVFVGWVAAVGGACHVVSWEGCARRCGEWGSGSGLSRSDGEDCGLLRSDGIGESEGRVSSLIAKGYDVCLTVECG